MNERRHQGGEGLTKGREGGLRDDGKGVAVVARGRMEW